MRQPANALAEVPSRAAMHTALSKPRNFQHKAEFARTIQASTNADTKWAGSALSSTKHMRRPGHNMQLDDIIDSKVVHNTRGYSALN